ncbi:MAG: hypothetical protein OEZ31_11950 [Nitrospirota bacterium]|nr:hypothetical protein [Nitrospirota bacterium]MDH5769649.1 hypothetical protein [Nitrospirota bacterium]
MKKNEHEGYSLMANREDKKIVEETHRPIKALKKVLKAMADFLGVSQKPNDAERKLKDIYKWLG